MTGRHRRVAQVMAIALIVLVAPGCNRVNYRWEQATVTFTFGPTMPGGGGYRDRIRDGSRNWNGLGLPVRAFQGSSSGGWTSDPCVNLARGLINGVHLRSIDGRDGTIGRTTPCVYEGSNRLANIDMVFDDDEIWWTSDSLNITASPYDFESVATHEMGHAFGWFGDHLQGTERCGDSGGLRHTMCAYIWAGTTNQRSIEAGDREPMRAAYGG